ncbi:MAG: LamG domain-containing protein, partial [bacterium]
MPTKNLKNRVFFKRLICFGFIFVFLFGGLVVPMKQAEAGVNSVEVGGMDIKTITKTLKEIKTKDQVKIKSERSWLASLNIFLYNALNTFFQRIALSISKGIATGDKGGKSLESLQNWGDYVKDAGQAASGDYIDSLSDWSGFNLCEPDLSAKINIGLRLFKVEEPDKPNCTWDKMKNNWDEAINDPDLLKNFSAVSFSSEQSDVGKWLILRDEMEEKKIAAKLAAEKKRLEGEGFVCPEWTVSGDCKVTPVKIKDLEATKLRLVAEAKEKEAQRIVSMGFTDTAWDITKKFGETLGKSLLNTLVKDYLNGTYTLQDAKKKLCDGSFGKIGGTLGKICDSDDSVSSPYAQNTSGGEQSAEAIFSKYIQTNLSESGNYDVLSELSSCDNSREIPGPTTCVIDSNFAQAVREKSTVQEAVKQEAVKKGLLDGNKSVGYKTSGSDAKEMTYMEGYPYRSLVILRKYRIIPVGWELAAEYFLNYGEDSDAPTLNMLMSAYDDASSPYYHFVDPNWVLKLPSGYCKVLGAGPELLSDENDISKGSDSNNDGDWDDQGERSPTKSITRNDQYCADEQSCIKEGVDGNCEYYGYCMEEKRLWRFDGEACDEINNTCKAFVGPKGEAVSYLKNSLDFDGCSKNNSGCQWYCNQFNSNENSLTSKEAVAHWSMDELIGGGAKVKDEAGSNDGSLKGNTSIATGKWGKALSFDGTGDYIEVQDNNSLDIQDDFSAELWLKTASVSEKAVDKYKNGDGYSCEVLGNGKWSCSHADNGNVISSVSATSVNDGKWHHVAWAVDGANKQYLYVDGVLEDTDSLSSHGVNISNDLALYIGINDGTSQGFNGQIDELSIYNRVLSGDEIWNNYLSYNCINNNDKIYLGDSAGACEAEDAGCNEYLIPENGLVGYWKFDKGEGAIAYDGSGYGNDGVLKNGAAWAGGKSGQSLSFDGADDYANVSHNDSLNTGDAATISFWVKRGTFGAAQYIVQKGTNSFAIGFDVNNYVFFGKSDAGTICLSTLKIEDNNWHNITITKNEATSKIYIDGADNTGAVADYTLANNGSPLTFGSNSGGTAGFLNGSIDEIAIYNRALSGQEIFSLYNSGINFSNAYIKAPNKNLQCFGRIAGDAVFDLPSYADNCISLGAHYDSYGYNTCFEFLSYKNENDCAANNGVWSSLPIKIPRHTVQSYCEKNGGVWTGAQCQTQCLKLDDAACSAYAFSCKSSELGCEEYTPTQGGAPVPGVISDDDLCPSECAGYDTYKQESTNFETSKFPVNFIPKTARSCPSNSAGCDEFTNLEAASRGGESLEYYKYLRQCENIPSESAEYKCGDFYTWIGSDTSGYQLQSYYLKSKISGNIEEPMEILRVEEYLGECNDANDALTNKNCKEFYNSEGVITYHLLKKTVTCSVDCVNYRKTLPSQFDLPQVCKNIGGTWASPNCNIASKQACKAVSGAWSGTCNPSSIADSVFCANANYLDGVWDADSSTCFKTDYSAIPTEGIKCSSSANGCRQYTGNAGSNVMNVFNDSFESDIYLYAFPDAGRGWTNGSLSSESTDSNQKSFKVNSGLSQIMTKWLSAECTLALAATCTKDAGCDCLESAGLNDGDATANEVVCTVPIDSDSCMAANYTYNQGTYLLSFWAKGNNADSIDIKITDGAKNQDFGSVTLSDQWQEFTLGPLELDVESWNNYQLSFEGIKSNGGTSDSALGAFFDNIKLQAISDSIYVIKDSWRTPTVCDQDWQGNSY